jgi:flagellar hook-associated protein 2
MAGLTSQGVGSGLDIAGLVAKLVAAEKAPRQTQITRAQTSTVTTISALANLKGALSSFKDALAPLETVDVFAARSATSSDQKVFSASATTSAVSGTYDVEVGNLASAHQISTLLPFAQGAGQSVGTGTLTISMGEQSFSLTIDQEHDSLSQIRDAINQATDNDNMVRATIVNAADGAHLVLSSQKSGEDHAITVSQTGGDGGLSVLEYNPSLTTNYRQLHEALDAVVFIAGYEHRSATNNFDNAIDGVSITLLDEGEEDEIYSVTVANDSAATTARIKKFVEAFNSLAGSMASLRSYEPTTKQAGPLLGDAMLRGLETDLRTKVTSAVSGLEGPYQSLASIGITTQKDGKLSLDATKLQAALENDFDGVAQLFGSAGGVASRLAGSLDRTLAADAQINTRTKALNARSVSLQKEQVALETRMATIEKRYNAQFNALDSLLSSMGSQSAFLSQQLTAISKIGDK